MVFLEIDFLYRETDKAIKFINDTTKKTIFNPELLKSNLAQDVMALTARAACADGEITIEELNKINKLLSEFGYGINESDCYEIQATVKNEPFEIPKTLRALTSKAVENVNSVKRLGTAVVKTITAFEMLSIGRAITAYASIMRYAAIENGFVPSEKRIIVDYIDNCINYVERTLKADMKSYCDYKPLLGQNNFTPLYAPMDGTILHVTFTEGAAITYHSLFAVISGKGTSCNVLSNAHGTLYKLKVKAGDTVKKNDLLAIISM